LVRPTTIWAIGGLADHRMVRPMTIWAIGGLADRRMVRPTTISVIEALHDGVWCPKWSPHAHGGGVEFGGF
jgi:hypothetical protein